MNHLKQLRALLDASGLDAMILTSSENRYYAVPFAFDDGYLFLDRKSSYLITDFRYQEAAQAAVGDVIAVLAPSSPSAFLQELLADPTYKRIGYEDKTLACALLHTWQKGRAFEAVALSEEIERLRAIKDGEEIQSIRRAQVLTDAAYTHILKTITPNMTEIEVALELEFFMRRSGAASASFPIIAVSGAASSLPHGTPQNRRLERGFLTMDFGAVVDGYCSDMTRTVVLGKADRKMKQIYDTVLAAQTLGMQSIRAGIAASEVDAAARRYIEQAGYPDAFGHSFGHGVGLQIHEAPRLSSRSQEVLAAGNVVTAEPGIYLPGLGGCRIENMGVVTEKGFDSFTESTRELIELF